MGIKFYCGNEFPEHEYDQFQGLKKILISKYEDSEEEIVILYNFFIKDMQIDVALIMNNGILLIEMKDYEGEIYGDELVDWFCKNSKGQEIKINSGSFRNPYIQCKAQRSMLTNKILELINNKKLAKFPVEKPIISRSIKSWLYFNGSSIYKTKENQTENNLIKRNPWFNIVNSENLAQEIDKIESNFKLIKEDIDVIVKSLNVRVCDEKIPNIKELKNPHKNNEKLITIGQVDDKFSMELSDIELGFGTVEEFKSKSHTKSYIELGLNVQNDKIRPTFKNLLYAAKFAIQHILYLIEKKATDMDIRNMDGLRELNYALTKQYVIISEPPEESQNTSKGERFDHPFILSNGTTFIIIEIDQDTIKIFNDYFNLSAQLLITFSKGYLHQEDFLFEFIDEDQAPRLKKSFLDNPLEYLNIIFVREELSYRKIKEGWFELTIREFNAFIDGDRFNLELHWSKDLDEKLINKIKETFIKIFKKILIGDFKDKRFLADFIIDDRLVKLSYAPLAAEKKVIDVIYHEIIYDGNFKLKFKR